MIDVERVLRESARRLTEDVDTAVVPELPRHHVHRRARHAALAAVAIGAVLLGSAALRDPTPDRLSPPRPAPMDTASDVVPQSIAPASTSPSEQPPIEYLPLSSLPSSGGPVVLSVPPDGHRPMLTVDTPIDVVEESIDPIDDWSRVLIELTADGTFTGRRIWLSEAPLEPWLDPYEGRGEPIGGDVTIGRFTGRWLEWVGTGLPRSFVALVGGQRLFTASGDVPDDELADLVATLQPSTTDGGYTLTAPPGFVEVENGTGTDVEAGDHRWMVNYGTEDLRSQLLVVAILNPRMSALSVLTMRPDGEQVTIGDWPGVLAENELMVWIEPNMLVRMSTAPPLGDPSGHPELDLVDLARHLATVSTDDWQRIQEQAQRPAAHPTPRDTQQCGITSLGYDIDPVEGLVPSLPFGAVPAGSTVTISLRPPNDDTRVDDVEIVLTDGPTSIELATADSLGEGTDFSLTWDGAFAGVPAPPGKYDVQVSATIIDLTGHCPPVRSTGDYVAFYVPVER